MIEKSENLMRLIMLIIVLLPVVACSNLEEQAQEHYAAAVSFQLAGETEQAAVRFRQVVAEFPETDAAKSAAEKLAHMEKHRQNLQRKELYSVLESLQTVIIGYQAMSGRFPVRMDDFDDGIYFFNSDYMIDLLPEDVTAWIELQGALQRYRIWLLREREPVAYSLGKGFSGVETLATEPFLTDIQSKFVVTQKQNLIFVEPTSQRKTP